MTHPAVAHLPQAFGWLLPELAQIQWPDETRADCGSCPMVAPERQVRFHPQIRCCTFHPRLPNFLLGRILRRGGVGAQRVRARIAQVDGVTLDGIAPSAEWVTDYDARSAKDYGRSADLRCPYWVAGELSCGIWEDRGAVCRTWFCRHTDGQAGHDLWHSLRRALRRVESSLGRVCLADLNPPGPPQSVDGWIGWYQACANHIDRLSPDQIAEVPGLEPLRATLLQSATSRRPPLPEVLVPSVESHKTVPEGIRLVGRSPYDDRVAPAWVAVLFEELDRQVPWRLARDRAQERVGEPIDDLWIENLYRWGLIDVV